MEKIEFEVSEIEKNLKNIYLSSNTDSLSSAIVLCKHNDCMRKIAMDMAHLYRLSLGGLIPFSLNTMYATIVKEIENR
jgi:hypothetical protein